MSAELRAPPATPALVPSHRATAAAVWPAAAHRRHSGMVSVEAFSSMAVTVHAAPRPNTQEQEGGGGRMVSTLAVGLSEGADYQKRRAAELVSFGRVVCPHHQTHAPPGPGIHTKGPPSPLRDGPAADSADMVT